MSVTMNPSKMRAKYNVEGVGQVTLEGKNENELETKLEALKAEHAGKAINFVNSEVEY